MVRLTAPSYDAWGKPDSGHAMISDGRRFGYTGQMWIPEIGMYYYKARMYSPTLGRFMQTDPIGYGDGMNIYAYVGNDPVNKVDPTGLRQVCRSSTVRILDESGYFYHSHTGTSCYDDGTSYSEEDLEALAKAIYKLFKGTDLNPFGGGGKKKAAEAAPQSDNCSVPGQTNAQRRLANSGDRAGFWQSRLDAGDPFARRALSTATGSDFLGKLANGWLFASLRDRDEMSGRVSGISGLNAEVNQIGVELMQAYSDQLGRGMNLDRWTAIHHAVFAEHGLSPSAYGGTPFFGYGQGVMNWVAGIESCP